MRTRHRYRGHRRSVVKSKSTLSRSRYTYARLKLYNIILHTKIVSPAILYTRNPIATAADWQSMRIDPLSSSDSRAQLLINYILCYTYYYIAAHRPPRERRHNIFHPFSVTSFRIFFYTSMLYTHTQVPPSCLSDRKHRRGSRPRGLYYYYYYYYIVYKRSLSSYISPISISYRNRTPSVTLIIVMYNIIYPRTFHIMYSVIRSYNCRSDPRCRPAAICSN